MKIAIIGAGGQLGTDCSALLSAKHEIITWDVPQLDITSAENVEKQIATAKPDLLINCAAYTAVDGCESEQQLAWKVNAEGPANLAKSAEKHNCRFIHVSTDYVFDGTLPAPQAYLETDKPNPVSQYGKSKLAGEQAVMENCTNHLILRTAWLYSASGKNFLKTMLRLAMADPQRQLKVVNDQYGSLTWSYSLALQIERLLESKLCGIVHTTSEGYSTWYEAACYFLQAMDVPFNIAPCTTAEYPTPAHRPANSILENAVLKNAKMNLFPTWQEAADEFVSKHKEALIQEAQKALGQ